VAPPPGLGLEGPRVPSGPMLAAAALEAAPMGKHVILSGSIPLLEEVEAGTILPLGLADADA